MTNYSPYWDLVTRLGEAQILLPAALLVVLALVRRQDARPLVLCWITLVGIAALLTTVTKVAFIGWGLGSSDLDFTGISGHAMFAAAVYPVLLASLAADASLTARRIAIAAGWALTLVIGVSRVVVGAHSLIEVLLGLLVGGVASTLPLALMQVPRARIGTAIPVVVAVWFALVPAHAPASQSHSMVTRLALMLSGRDTPYVREDLFRRSGSGIGIDAPHANQKIDSRT